MIILIILIILVLLSLILINETLNNKETILDEVKLQEDAVKNDAFAFQVEQDDGTYKAQTEMPLKEDGYIFNKEMSNCIDAVGNIIEDVIQYRNNKIRVKVHGSSYCFIYFDKITDGDFCVDRGITNLKDCLLVSEDYSYDTEEAIDYINNKGNADTTKIAPTITFISTSSSNSKNENGVLTSLSDVYASKEYTFDSSTGRYTLKNYTLSSDNLNGYYICGVWYNNTCTKMYKINAYKKVPASSGNKIVITDADIYETKSTDIFDSEIGLYATEDNDGKTYYYRGAVKNNYVSFGGFIWRVVRINGDGTIRMIYAGKSATEIGEDDQIGTSQYNTKDWDPTYVGYTYDDSNMVYRESDTLSTYSYIYNSNYVYGKEISCDDITRTCKLTGETMSGVWEDVHETILNEGYKYTCFSTDVNYNCNWVMKLDSYVSSSSAKGYYISYNSPDYKTTLKSTTNSTIKEYIDNWYEDNLLNTKDSNGTKYSEYLDNNATFCNDRSIADGTGYLISSATYYSGHYRISNGNPSLKCKQEQDRYSVAKGNLKYPIALITGDEASFAGLKHNSQNNMSYLYTGEYFHTMTPKSFFVKGASAVIYQIVNDGMLRDHSDIRKSYGVRPVINLKSNVKIVSGKGTSSSPYIISMN